MGFIGRILSFRAIPSQRWGAMLMTVGVSSGGKLSHSSTPGPLPAPLVTMACGSLEVGMQ